MFEDYAVIPLAVGLAPAEHEDLRHFVQSHCETCAFTANVIRYIGFNARKPIRNGAMVLYASDPGLYQVDETTPFDWDPVFAEHFPSLVAWIESFPFKRLFGMTLVTQTDDIPEHMDIFGNNNSITMYETFRQLEPQFYRIILAAPDDRVARSQAFYVTQQYQGPRQYVALPDDCSAFALSSSTCYHGASYHRGHFKSTIALYGELDSKAHHRLLAKSLAEYPGQAIRLQRPGPVGGPAMNMPYAGPDTEPAH